MDLLGSAFNGQWTCSAMPPTDNGSARRCLQRTTDLLGDAGGGGGVHGRAGDLVRTLGVLFLHLRVRREEGRGLSHPIPFSSYEGKEEQRARSTRRVGLEYICVSFG